MCSGQITVFVLYSSRVLAVVDFCQHSETRKIEAISWVALQKVGMLSVRSNSLFWDKLGSGGFLLIIWQCVRDGE